jgi:hypothetical protein
MEKVVVISKDVYFDLDKTGRDKFLEFVNESSKENKIVFISNNPARRNELEEVFGDKHHYGGRRWLKEIINKNKDKLNHFLFVGNKDQDFYTAVNIKVPLLYPLWTRNIESKAKQYGYEIHNVDELRKFIGTYNNQNSWYFSLDLPDGSKVYSLICAHYYSLYIPEKERELVIGFEKLLKDGNKLYFKVFLAHFIASMTNKPEFRDIDIWSVFPSSGLELNEDMMFFKEKVRTTTKVRNPHLIESGQRINNLFIRHTQITKSHLMRREDRKKEGCVRHFKSIYLNDAYKGKLKGKNICVFDDYLTHGNSFEAARNLLRKEGVNNIIFVSIGRFNNPYIYQEYAIDGDAYTSNYNYAIQMRSELNNSGDVRARRELENLYKIFDMH